MARILRGEIYWADLNPVRGHEQAGLRPVLVISHEELHSRSDLAIVLAITSKTQRAGYPLTYKLRSGNLPKESWVFMTQVRTVSTERLGKRLGVVSQEDMVEIVEGLIELVA